MLPVNLLNDITIEDNMELIVNFEIFYFSEHSWMDTSISMFHSHVKLICIYGT